MNTQEITQLFTTSFTEASNITASTYSSCIRFIAIMLVLIAVIWTINHFMGAVEREQEGFLITLGSRLIRLVIGLTLFTLFLIVKGNAL